VSTPIQALIELVNVSYDRVTVVHLAVPHIEAEERTTNGAEGGEDCVVLA